MVFALGTAFLAKKHVSLVWALAFSVGFIALQYAVSPWIIKWVLSIYWDENELPAVNRAFIDSTALSLSQFPVSASQKNLRPPVCLLLCEMRD
jgi:hypothetical protein